MRHNEKLTCFVLLFVVAALIVHPVMADTLVLPVSLTSIKEEVFRGDTSITRVVLPEGVISIED